MATASQCGRVFSIDLKSAEQARIRGHSAQPVLFDQPVKGLAIDAGRTGGLRNVPAVLFEQIINIRGLEPA